MPTILVVDDSEMDRRLVGRLLEKEGNWGVAYAADGKAALDLFRRSAPDLVVTDLQMPEMNGLELMTNIKSDFPLTPVILMTAQGSEEIATEALRRGAASYVPKRQLADELNATVARVLLAAREDRAHSRLMHHLTESDLSFELGADVALLSPLVGFLQQLLRCAPLGDETERLRVGLAVEEALKNAYYHGTLEIGTGAGWPQRKAIEQIERERLLDECYQNRLIRVRAKISRTEVSFVIRDEGPGFDTSRIPEPGETAECATGTGRGLVLMRMIMDEIRYNDKGNEVTMIKRPRDDNLSWPGMEDDPVDAQ